MLVNVDLFSFDLCAACKELVRVSMNLKAIDYTDSELHLIFTVSIYRMDKFIC